MRVVQSGIWSYLRLLMSIHSSRPMIYYSMNIGIWSIIIMITFRFPGRIILLGFSNICAWLISIYVWYSWWYSFSQISAVYKSTAHRHSSKVLLWLVRVTWKDTKENLCHKENRHSFDHIIQSEDRVNDPLNDISQTSTHSTMVIWLDWIANTTLNNSRIFRNSRK